MLSHGQKVSFFVSGSDGQNNQIAMGGGPVCPQSNIPCDSTSNGATPDWSNDLSTYTIREEFIPEFDSSNSSFVISPLANLFLRIARGSSFFDFR